MSDTIYPGQGAGMREAFEGIDRGVADEQLAGVVLANPGPRETLLAMSKEERDAHLEFREAAREARATQEAAQRAAKRYADAIKRLSEVCAPPTVPTE